MTNQWVPIESAPKDDGTRILVVNEDGEIDVAEYVAEWQEHQEFVRKAKDGDVFRTVVEDIGYWNTERAHCPTHWQPLPIPPLARGQAEQVTSGWSLRYVYFDENGIPLMHREPEERNFCQRCGKPVNLTTIHTCTPPRENT